MEYICYGVKGSRPTPFNLHTLSQCMAKLILDLDMDGIQSMISKAQHISSESQEMKPMNVHEALETLIEEKLVTFNRSLLNVAGNTPCVEVRQENVTNGIQIIFDLGTGATSVDILDTTRVLHIFFTHFHYDHVQGMLFFNALFNKNITVHFYSPVKGFDKYLNELMNHPYFPITMAESMTSKIFFHLLQGDKPIKLHGLSISWKEINHPGGCYAYKVSDRKKSFCYFTDVNITDDLFKPSKHNKIFLEDIDTMIVDASMSFQDSIIKRYWGHSSFYRGIDFAHFWNIKHIALFHFDPVEDITTIPLLLQSALWYKKSIDANVSIDLAEEGKWLKV